MKPTPVGNTYEQLIADLTPRYGAGEARSIARIVFEDVFQTKNPVALRLDANQEKRYLEIRDRLISGEPLQYVLGQADFFGLKFKVGPAVLIPRQETEELVAWALDWLKHCEIQTPAVLDIGLGSGCIGVSLKAKFRAMHLHGLEKSPAALAVANENAEKLLGKASWNFVCADITEPAVWPIFQRLDLIIANPPYIPFSEKKIMPEHVLAHEPAMALFVEDSDPLLFYREIGRFALQKLNPAGALFFETNEFNAKDVADMLGRMGFTIELRSDLSGADRMLMARPSRAQQPT
ncbi:MAG: peptide chain release factor N(5)-glutamine methyltransferase [Lewinellaceae bacterium]|nr:peptide chain release factor N(5)-glutamine methyltransferase [Lewinellaceae bacterium]